MATMKQIAEGLQILLKYEDDEEDCAAEHDIFYAGAQDVDVSEEDAAKLDELGWHFDDDEGRWARFT